MAQVLGPSTAHNREDRAIEDVYQKKTQLEHILLRPDTYIGSIEHQQQTLWVHDGEKMVSKSVSFVPGLYKIFDEILVNAADNKVRDSTMDTLRVDVDEVRSLLRCTRIAITVHARPISANLSVILLWIRIVASDACHRRICCYVVMLLAASRACALNKTRVWCRLQERSKSGIMALVFLLKCIRKRVCTFPS